MAELLLEFTLWLKNQTPLVNIFPGVLEATQTPYPHVHPWQNLSLLMLPFNKKQPSHTHPDTMQYLPLIFPSQGLALISAVNI